MNISYLDEIYEQYCSLQGEMGESKSKALLLLNKLRQKDYENISDIEAQLTKLEEEMVGHLAAIKDLGQAILN